MTGTMRSCPLPTKLWRSFLLLPAMVVLLPLGTALWLLRGLTGGLLNGVVDATMVLIQWSER